MKIRLFILLCLLTFLSASCTRSSKDLNSNFKISKPDVKINIKNKTVRIGGIDFNQVNYPIGKFGGSLKLSYWGSGPKTFNYWASTDAGSSELSALMYDSLFDTHPITGEIIPKLAKSFEILDGGKKIIVKLRDGVKWSDGKEITSDDVVFTWNDIVFSGIEGSGFQALCLIDGKFPTVRKIDNKTIEFKTHTVFAPFLRQISYAPAPKHVFEKIIKGKNFDEAKKDFIGFWGAHTNPKELVTSGPFRLSRYIDGERVEFERNENYYFIDKNNDKLPYVEKIIYFLVQDKSMELFKFLAGEIDVLTIRGEDVPLIKDLYKKNNKFNVVNLGPTTSTEFLIFNLHQKDGEVKREWFNKLNFRQAISHAIDRHGIVDNVLGGIGKPLFTAESHASIYLNKKIAEGYKQDLKFSKSLLLKNGFKYDANGNLIDSKNNLVEFTILTNAENLSRQYIATIIQDDLKKLGIKVNIRPMDFNTLIMRSDGGDWDAIILGLTGDSFEPNSGSNVWKLSGRLHMFDQKPHKPRDWEVEIDKIFNDATKVVEFEKRKKYYDRFQEIVYKQLPFIYLVSPLRIIAYQKNLYNVYPTVYGGVLHNLESVHK